MEPIICFGQQPNGFFPKRYLAAKIRTARKLQKEIGGKIVFFYHDSDADYKETITIMKDRTTGAEERLNFLQKNRIQKKYSPLYKKEIPEGWQETVSRQLPRFVDNNLISLFKAIKASNAADFCLAMYEKLGLLEGIEVMRSSSKEFREKANDLQDFYCDVEYEAEGLKEIVRAKMEPDGRLSLHEGGGKYIYFSAPAEITKSQKSPGRDERFAWMQSVIGATHYILGEGEKGYLKPETLGDVILVDREKVENSEYAELDINS